MTMATAEAVAAVADAGEQDDEPRVYEVPEGRLDWLEEQVGKLAKRAAKLGVPAPRLVVLGHRIWVDVEWTIAGKRERKTPVTDVRVEGEAPKLPGGWELVATLQHTPAGNLLRTVPGREGDLPLRFREADPRHCDHCGTCQVLLPVIGRALARGGRP
jgi:hypothetical protein